MALSNYVIARQAIYWKFPGSTQRLAYIAVEAEISKIAWQASDDTLWLLTAAPGTWVQIGTGAIVPGALIPKNVITTPTTIDTDTSYIVASYLTIADVFTVNGNLAVIG